MLVSLIAIEGAVFKSQLGGRSSDNVSLGVFRISKYFRALHSAGDSMNYHWLNVMVVANNGHWRYFFIFYWK